MAFGFGGESSGYEEVGASFVVEDKASAALGRIGEAFEGIQAGLDAAVASAAKFSEMRFGNVARSVRNLTDAVGTLSDSTEALPAAFESAMSKVVAETERGMLALRAMTTEMREMSAVGDRMFSGGGRGGGGGGGRGGGGSGGGGSGGRGGGGHGITASGVYRHGLMSGFMFSPAGIIAGLGMEHALHMAGNESLDVTNMMSMAGVNDPQSPANAGLRDQVYQMVADAATGTVYNRAQVAHAGVPFMGIASGGFKNEDGSPMTPEQKLKAASGVFRPVVQFAEQQEQMGLGSIDDNVKAGVKYMHLLRDYDPAKLEKDLDELAAISRSTGSSARAVEAIEKYSITIGTLAGSDPHTIAKMTGYLGQAGVTGSTAGTGLSSVILEGLKPDAVTGHETAIGHKIRSDVERALKGEGPQDTHYGKKDEVSAIARQNQERKDMGLVGADGKPTYLDAHGNVDVMKEIKIVSDYSAKMDELGKHAAAATAILDVFKTRAGRALEPFLGKENQAQLKAYMDWVDDTAKHRGTVALQNIHAKEPIQEFEQTWRRLEDLMSTVATGPLHQLGDAALRAAGYLDSITKYMDNNKQAALTTGDAAIGAGIGAGVGALVAGVGALPGAAIGGALGAAYANKDSIMLSTKQEHDRIDHELEETRKHNMDAIRNWWRGSGERGHQVFPGGTQPQSYHPAGGAPAVHIDNISFHGMSVDPEEHAEQLSDALARALGRAQLHDLGSGGGFLHSTFATGREVQT